MLQARLRAIPIRALLALAVGLTLFGPTFAPTAGATPTMTVVAQGLDNPRGLAITPSGAIYVAEAGKGGPGPCVQSPEDGGESCFGKTGAVTRIWKGKQERVVTGLPSVAGADGSASGPVDVDPLGLGVVRVVLGLSGTPETRAALGPDAQALGHLITVFPNGKWLMGADISGYEAAANPDGGEVDTNPYSLASRGIFHSVVADAGGNDLLQVEANGKISTLATFPDVMVDAPPFLEMPEGAQIPMQAVPTSVTVGPDGAYYVGQLTGFPFPVGAAKVWRVVPGQAPTVYAEGFTNIIDLAFGRDGSLYVLEIAKDGLLAAESGSGGSLPLGSLIRVATDGSKSEIASEGLFAPGGLAIGKDGAIYVSNYSVAQGAGQVVRIKP